MELTAHWAEEPPLGVVARHWLGVKPRSAAVDHAPKEMTPQQWEQFVGAEKAFAERHGR